MAGDSLFFKLPIELRELIYSSYFKAADHLHVVESLGGAGRYKFEFDLLRTSKAVYAEAQRVWRRENVFIRLETPWPTDVHRISAEGLVPFVACDDRAALCESHSALIQITAPFYTGQPEHTIVLLLDDLNAFCNLWHYSALSYPQLNENLCCSFTIHNVASGLHLQPVSTKLQQQILLPFGKVKGLRRVEYYGFDLSVKEELEREMAVPPPSVQQCCENAADLMEEGDRLLALGNVERALEKYVASFHALHIIVSGRIRRALADSYYHNVIPAGVFKGQSASFVRIVFRIRLVARVIRVYLLLGEVSDAVFWGMRSIRLMRGLNSGNMGSPALLDLGYIYGRTAMGMSLLKATYDEDTASELGDLHMEYQKEEGDMGLPNVLWQTTGILLKGPSKEIGRNLIRAEAEGLGLTAPQELYDGGANITSPVANNMVDIFDEENSYSEGS